MLFTINGLLVVFSVKKLCCLSAFGLKKLFLQYSDSKKVVSLQIIHKRNVYKSYNAYKFYINFGWFTQDRFFVVASHQQKAKGTPFTLVVN